jgi:phenylacetic acid degradation operon negative regulatory protein
MGIKERRTKILTLIFLIADLTDKIVNIDEKIQKVFDITLNQKTRSTLNSLEREGLIEKSDLGYKLTELGLKELFLKFPFFRFLKEKWDGKWRVLSYEIPEKKRDLRDRLRREVAGWGLGPWHRSFWLTPHPIINELKNLVSGKEEEQYIQAFEADHVFGERKVLIEKVWGINELDKQYRGMFKKWHLILSEDQDKTEKLKKAISEYIILLRQDPGLPIDLVGENWIGFEAFNIYKEIRGILLT